MSDTTAAGATSTPPVTPEATAAAVPPKPIEPPPPLPFNADILTSCTARFTRKAWDILLKLQKENLDLLKTVPLRITLKARSPKGATDIHHHLMKSSGVTEIQVKGDTIYAVATFEDIQTVIKNPESLMCDATRISP
ncbi:MAG: hypothetical protein K2X66_02170 [Cyanobacteria bacterium]|nr:hypothetical protein [Cyanobacteriota bacterium]